MALNIIYLIYHYGMLPCRHRMGIVLCQKQPSMHIFMLISAINMPYIYFILNMKATIDILPNKIMHAFYWNILYQSKDIEVAVLNCRYNDR